jgi:ankyrin repeat protein
LISDELFFSLALMLGPLGTWRLQTLSNRMSRQISIDSLPQQRQMWGKINNSADEDVPLVDLLRSGNPSMSMCQRKGLLQTCGQKLLSHQGSALSPDSSGQTAITWAVDYGLIDVLKLLVGPVAGSSSSFQVLLNTPESNGWYPLFRAAWGGRTECVKVLLVARADPEGLEGRYSPLIAAARWGHEDVVSILLEAQASPDRKNVYDEDALMLARGQGHSGVVRLLKEAIELKGHASTIDEPQDDWKNGIHSRYVRQSQLKMQTTHTHNW